MSRTKKTNHGGPRRGRERQAPAPVPAEARAKRREKPAYFDADLAERVEARLEELGKSFSLYVNELVRKDLGLAD